MKFLTLIVISMALFTISAYRTEQVSTLCFFVNSGCHKQHMRDVEKAINQRPGEYLSHSTTSTKNGMHSLIVYK
jgi:hypothetical protein